LIQGKSQRAAAIHFGLSRNTVAKLLVEEEASNVRQYQRQAPCKTPVRDAALPHIEKWLKENEWLERWAPKQCWTAHRMWVELRKLGIPIGESTVRMYVQEKHQTTKTAFVPLDFAPGEHSHLGPLITHAPDVGPLAEVLVHSTGRVRFQTNDYSAPIQYAYQRLTLKADPFRVRLSAGEELVADHPRCYEKRQVIEDWRHYVPLLLKKSFAVPWASALRHADLPSSFEAARQELVTRRADGNREFARLLELGLTHTVEAVDAAVALARGQGDWSADTVRQLLRWAAEEDSTALPLDPTRYPAYQGSAPPPDLSAYNRLLEVRS